MPPTEGDRDPPTRPQALGRAGVAVAAIGCLGFAFVHLGWFPTLDTDAGADDYAAFEVASYAQLGFAVLVGIGGMMRIGSSRAWRRSPVVGALLIVASAILGLVALSTGFAGAWDA